MSIVLDGGSGIISGASITQNSITGTLVVAHGGTGQTAITVNGSLLIGNTVSGGFDVSTIARGAGISVTTDKGSTTVAATGTTVAPVQATTSGTTFNFGNIPAGTKHIRVMFRGVSLSGTDHFLVRIGTSGGIETTGYVSSGTNSDGTNGTTFSSTVGFIIAAELAAYITSGVLTLDLMDAENFIWIASHSLKFNTSAGGFGGGDKALSAELTQVEVLATGVNTFDAGSLSISYHS